MTGGSRFERPTSHKFLETEHGAYDAILLDVDNGPGP